MSWRDRIAQAITDGIKAYHSSPHDFERFDLSKIGTGEGAQVYGHGIYAAENPAVSGQGGEYWNKFLDRFSGPEREAARQLKTAGFDRNAAVTANQRDIGQILGTYGDRLGADPRYDDALARMRQQDELLRNGAPVGPRTYELNIKADPAHFLDWDKPLDSQNIWDRLHPEVRNSIDDLMEERMQNPMSDALEAYTGKNLYRTLKHYDVHDSLPAELPGSSWATGATDEAKHTSAYLDSLGIPGIRYLDQASRAAGQGTSNYVVFNPDTIDILKKYSVVGVPAATLGGLAAQDQYQGQQ